MLCNLRGNSGTTSLAGSFGLRLGLFGGRHHDGRVRRGRSGSILQGHVAAWGEETGLDAGAYVRTGNGALGKVPR